MGVSSGMGTMSELPQSQYMRTTAEMEAERRALLASELDEFPREWTRPNLQPLGDMLEINSRLEACREMTYERLINLHATGFLCMVYGGVYLEGKLNPMDFLVITWKGVFLIWAVDPRGTWEEAVEAMRRRNDMRELLGEDWEGDVEAVFNAPRDRFFKSRIVGIDEESGEAVDVVSAGGPIDVLLQTWEPRSGMLIDPEWIRWLSQASEPRWWEADMEWERDRTQAPQLPADEQC